MLPKVYKLQRNNFQQQSRAESTRYDQLGTESLLLISFPLDFDLGAKIIVYCLGFEKIVCLIIKKYSMQKGFIRDDWPDQSTANDNPPRIRLIGLLLLKQSNKRNQS